MHTVDPLADRPAFRWLTTAHFGPVPVVAAMLLAVAAVAYAWPTLQRGHTPYPDVVAGMVGWDDGDKPADTAALAIGAVVGAAAAVSIGRAFRAVAPDGPASPVGAAVAGLLLLSLAPAAWRLTVAAVQPADVLPPVRLLAAAPLAVAVFVAGLRKFDRATVTPAHVWTAGGAAVLSPAVAAFAVLAVAVTTTRLAPATIDPVARLIGPAVATAVGAAVAGVVACWWTAADPDAMGRRLLRGLTLWQLPVPLLLSYLLPPPVLDLAPSHRFDPGPPWRLAAVLAVLAGVGVWTVARRLRTPPITLSGTLAVVTLVGLAIYCNGPTDSEVPSVSRDFFHWGEQALPWQQWYQLGRRPYADFAPIHALMAYVRGGLNQLFFGGTAATWASANAVLAGLTVAATVAAGAWLLGPVAALVLVFAPVPGMDRLWLLPAAVYVTAAPRTWRRRPAAGLVGWFAVAVVTAAYNPSVGLAFAATSAPVAACSAAPAGWRRLSVAFATIAAVVGTAMAVPPVRATVVGFVGFVRENAATNTVANDIPWATLPWNRDSGAGLGSTQVLWQAARVAWVGVAAVAAATAWWAAGLPRDRRPAGVVPLGVLVAAVLVAASPWTMGRIDVASWSRPGAISGTAVTLLLPPLLLLARPTPRTVLAVAVLLGLTYPYGGGMTGFDPWPLAAKATQARRVSPAAVVLDGASVGLPNLGRIVRPTPDWPDEVADLNRLLGRVLRPGETFLDLANDQAIYFYTGRPTPVRYDSYVAASSAMQLGELRQLAEHPVPVVLIGPAPHMDHAPASVRCYRLYRYYATRYVPVPAGPFTLLVEPGRAGLFPTTRPGPTPTSGIRPATRPDPALPLDEYRRLMLDEAFDPEPLWRLPVAWGRSWPALRPRFTTVATVTAGRAVPGVPFAVDVPVPSAVTTGAAADFLLVDLKLTVADPVRARDAERLEPAFGTAEPDLTVRWLDRAGRVVPTAASFKGHTGRLLVPLGSYPRWLLCDHPSAVRLRVDNPAAVRGWELTATTFLHLDDE